MHELSVTQGLLKICLDESEKCGASRVLKVNIKVGELTGLIPTYITEYFNIVAKDTIAEFAEVNVEKVSVGITCLECNYEGDIGNGKYCCPKCNGNKYKIIRGREFYLDTMEVD